MNKKKYSNNAIAKSNTKKQKLSGKSMWHSRVSIHVRVLGETKKAFKIFGFRESITTQGLLEYFMCLLLDDDEQAMLIMKRYKEALKREGTHIIATDADDIFNIIEENNPFNET